MKILILITCFFMIKINVGINISYRDLVTRPPCNFLVGIYKIKLYENKSSKIIQLRMKIRPVVGELENEICKRVITNFIDTVIAGKRSKRLMAKVSNSTLLRVNVILKHFCTLAFFILVILYSFLLFFHSFSI